jgi:hypothetical protein
MFLSGTTMCWIAAEHALQHARNNAPLISEVFGRHNIQESEYLVLAGFDESLIKSGVGYLEQIHVFVNKEVEVTSLLLSEFGKLFSPFSSILFTESSSYHLPVFKYDGSMWEFDELVYHTASKFVDGGSSAKTPLTIISLCCATSSPADSTITSSQPYGSASGEGENSRQTSENLKGKKKETRDKDDEANKGNKEPSGDPDNPNQDGNVNVPSIFFDISSKIHLNEEKQNSDLENLNKVTFQYDEPRASTFQTLNICGELTINLKVFIYHCIPVSVLSN